MHANSGVEKGMAAGGKPVEIMGMMIGRPDTETPNALIVTDVSFVNHKRVTYNFLMWTTVVMPLLMVSSPSLRKYGIMAHLREFRNAACFQWGGRHVSSSLDRCLTRAASRAEFCWQSQLRFKVEARPSIVVPPPETD